MSYKALPSPPPPRDAKQPGVPPFDANGDRYDMDTFIGRVYHRYRMIDPRGLAYTPGMLRDCQDIIARHQKGERTGYADEELWTMKFNVEGGVHPTTNQVITPLLRMSAYIPVNVPIVLAMTMPVVVANPYATATVHFVNQSFNCVVNYANRSGEGQGVDAIAKAYVAAVSLSMAGGLGATFAVKRLGGNGLAATMVRATLPFCAVVASGCANVGIMRWPEWQTEGVPILDDEGNARGKSLAAGQRGMNQCWTARFLWNIPPMVMPALLSIPLSRIAFLQPKMRMVETAICLAGIGFGLPLALAYFKPYASITADELEPEFRNLTNSKGEPVKNFTFYKGI
jgi:tricarboxylate carrier